MGSVVFWEPWDGGSIPGLVKVVKWVKDPVFLYYGRGLGHNYDSDLIPARELHRRGGGQKKKKEGKSETLSQSREA